MFTMSMLGVTPLIQEKLVASSGMEKNAALAAGSLTGALLAGVATHPWTRSRVACRAIWGARSMMGSCRRAEKFGERVRASCRASSRASSGASL